MAVIVAVGLFVKRSSTFTVTTQQKTITVGSKKVSVEIANTPVSRAQGLSERSSLDSNSGMLFVFDPKGETPGFWMKGMLFPLDFIWIANGKVVKIDKNVQPYPSGTPDNQLKAYYPDQPIDHVLEVNGGFSDRNHIQIGDTVDLSGAI